MTDTPNPVTAVASMLRARRVRAPKPLGSGDIEHGGLQPVLDDLASRGIGSLVGNGPTLEAQIARAGVVRPDLLSPPGALAFWINLYNTAALVAAREAWVASEGSMLRLPGVFSRPVVDIDGETLSLDDIEHGKIRRFGDPRIHAALVCGSVSCPTLRHEPFTGPDLDRQLDDQMRVFLRAGGVIVDRAARSIRLNRIFRWYSRDFTRPDTMPNLLPAMPGLVRDTVAWWLPDDDRTWVWTERPTVEFMPYDWGLACAVSPVAR